MPGTNRIYEEPSRLSQWLVVGLSVAVVAMGGWFAVTIRASQTGTSEGDDAAATPPRRVTSRDGTPVAGTDAMTQRTTSVHFDWPKFPSVPATPTPGTAMPLAPDPPPTRGFEGPAWTTPAPDARNTPSRPPAGRTAEAADAIVDILAPPPSRTPATAPPARQTQRKPKPRGENDAAGSVTAAQ